MGRGHVLTIVKVDEHSSMLTRMKRLLPINFGADLSSLSDNDVGKHFANSRHMKIQPASGLRILDALTENTPMEPHLVQRAAVLVTNAS